MTQDGKFSRAMAKSGDALQEVSLAENDIIYVPPTLLARVGYVLGDLLFPVGNMLGLGTMDERTSARVGVGPV